MRKIVSAGLTALLTLSALVCLVLSAGADITGPPGYRKGVVEGQRPGQHDAQPAEDPGSAGVFGRQPSPAAPRWGRLAPRVARSLREWEAPTRGAGHTNGNRSTPRWRAWCAAA